jgi:3-methyladenine DNA glycosylase/8-oxoguanine DNA glycosylase
MPTSPTSCHAARVPDASATFTVDGPLDLRLTLRLLRVGPLDPTMVVHEDEAWIAVHPSAGPSALHVRRVETHDAGAGKGSARAGGAKEATVHRVTETNAIETNAIETNAIETNAIETNAIETNAIETSVIEARAFGPAAAWLVEQAPRFVGASYAPRAFGHPALDEAAALRRGLRPCVAPVLVDVIVRYVAQQRVTFVDAASAYRQLVLRFGAKVSGTPEGLRAPPSARQLASLPYYELHPFGLERRRAETIVSVAKRATRIEALRDAPFDEVRTKLALFRGVGPWTREMVLATALGDFDAVPLGDYHLPHLVAWTLTGTERDRARPGPDPDADRRMLELLAPFAGQRFRALQMLDAFQHTTGGPFRPEPRRGPRHPRMPWVRRSDR